MCNLESGTSTAQVISELIAAKASYTSEDQMGRRPLMWAVCEGRVGCCAVLLEHKANPIVPDKGSFPLHAAAKRGYTEVCELLLCHKADVNAVDEQGDTPLLHAVEFSHADACTLLLQHQVRLHQPEQPPLVLGKLHLCRRPALALEHVTLD